MADLFDYLYWRGDLTFEQSPFNNNDALCLSQLSYIDFSDLVDSSFSKKITLAELTDSFFKTENLEKRLDMGIFINTKTPDFLLACAKSKRFENIKLCGFREIINKEQNIQFTVVTFVYEKTNYIVFRGTDDSVIGWREDFTLAYSDELPSHKEALNYFSDALDSLNKDFILIGHSKGANVAINTSVKCTPKQQKRIRFVYNFDGPGFPESFYRSFSYVAISKRILSFYPKYAVVGTILTSPTNYSIVNSSRTGIMQHDILSWQITPTDFDYTDDFAEHSYIIKKSLNEWLQSYSSDDKNQFVNALFEVIEASDAKTLSEIDQNKISSTTKMIAKFSSLEKNTKKEVSHMFLELGKLIQSELSFFKIFTLD